MRQSIFTLLISLATLANSQIWYGENWTNTPQMLTPEVRQYLNEKLPAGESYVGCFRNDKYAEDGIDKAPDSEINNIIALHNELRASGKFLKLIYTFDARGRCSVTDAFYAWDKFVEAGIDIIGARFGNEEYGKKAGHWINGIPNFDHYYNFCTPLISALNSRNYTGYYLFTLAKPEPEFDGWNDDAEFIIDSKSNYSGDIHLYWNQEECEAFNTYLLVGDSGRKDHLPPAVITSNVYSTADGFYHDLYFEVTQSDLIETTFADFISRYPGKRASITECGPGGAVGNLGNTLGYEATVDWFFNTIKNYPVFVVCKFNGPSVTGSITQRSNKDKTDLPSFVRRLDHYTQAQFMRNKNAIPLSQQINQPGEYCISVHNMNRIEIDLREGILIADGLYIETFEYEYISGSNYYSSSGVCQWWATGSDKTYEITGSQFSGVIPGLSFGYVHVTVSIIPVYGCTDPEALNYDPLANTSDGSCYYQSDCRCKDIAADNEDLTAPCTNNELCVYPPPPPQDCWKERKIFKFLGCKRDPECEVNNCLPN